MFRDAGELHDALENSFRGRLWCQISALLSLLAPKYARRDKNEIWAIVERLLVDLQTMIGEQGEIMILKSGAGQEVHTGRHENNRVTKYGISGPVKSIIIKPIVKSALVGIGCRMSPRWWPVCDAAMRTLHLGRC